MSNWGARRRVRYEAMQRLWPDHPGSCTLRITPSSRRVGPGRYAQVQCGAVVVPLTVESDYLSVRCPSCRVVTIHQRVIPLDG